MPSLKERETRPHRRPRGRRNWGRARENREPNGGWGPRFARSLSLSLLARENREPYGEYWIVEPDAEFVLVLALEGETYREHGSFGRGSTLRSAMDSALTLDATALFDEA